MKVLVRYDVQNWAFWRRAEGFRRNPPPGWIVQTAPDSYTREREQWDAVLFLDVQADVAPFEKSRTAKYIGSHAWLFDPDPNDLRARGANKNRCRDKAKGIVSNCDVVAVHNRAQQSFFSTIHPRVVLAPYCPDLSDFKNPGYRQHERLKVGWCQQMGGGLNNFKGLPDVLVPVIARVGELAEWSVLTPDAKTALNTDALCKWYQSLDVFLCTSSAEGGPHGPFEAAACGCAVISTDVGQVSDWKALHEVGLRVPTYRNADEAFTTAGLMAEKLLYLIQHRDVLRNVSRLMCESIHDNYNANIEYPRQLAEVFRAA